MGCPSNGGSGNGGYGTGPVTEYNPEDYGNFQTEEDPPEDTSPIIVAEGEREETNPENQDDVAIYGDPEFERGWLAGWADCDMYCAGYYDAIMPAMRFGENHTDRVYATGYADGLAVSEKSVEQAVSWEYLLERLGSSDVRGAGPKSASYDTGYEHGWSVCVDYAVGFYSAFWDKFYGAEGFSEDVYLAPEPTDDFWLYDTGYNDAWPESLIQYRQHILENAANTPPRIHPRDRYPRTEPSPRDDDCGRDSCRSKENIQTKARTLFGDPSLSVIIDDRDRGRQKASDRFPTDRDREIYEALANRSGRGQLYPEDEYATIPNGTVSDTNCAAIIIYYGYDYLCEKHWLEGRQDALGGYPSNVDGFADCLPECYEAGYNSFGN